MANRSDFSWELVDTENERNTRTANNANPAGFRADFSLAANPITASIIGRILTRTRRSIAENDRGTLRFTMRLKVRHTVYLEPDLSKKLLARSKKTGALPTEIVRRALREYLKRVK
jgi:hypothetical protein